MSTYKSAGTGSTLSNYSVDLSEQHLYGSSRLGIFNRSVNMKAAYTQEDIVSFYRGYKQYELSNHLGNVLVTITDKKNGVSTNGTTIDNYAADVSTANDYYPFGMGMSNRKFSTDKYRYGFNGKELDKEVFSTSSYDYGFRIYNPGLSKFLSVDPLSKSYHWYTPYQFAGNKPTIAIDVDGLEDRIVISGYISKQKPITKTESAIGVLEQSSAHEAAINGIMNRLDLQELKAPKQPPSVLEWGTMGELTINEQRETIENTVREFTICIGTSRNINPDFNPNVVNETYTATYDFNYGLLGNKEKVDEIKAAVKKATTVIDYASKIREVTGKLPKVLDKISAPSSIVASAMEGDGLGVATEVAKVLVEKGLTELAKKAPSLAPAIGVLKGNPISMTIQLSFSNSAPTNNNNEIKSQRIEQLRLKTIGALLYLFENNNIPYSTPGGNENKPAMSSDHPEDVRWKKNIPEPPKQ